MCSIISIFLIVLMVQSGLAIRCFICDSSTNKKCTDLSDKNITAEECTYEKLHMDELKDDAYYKKHWLVRMSETNFYKQKNPFEITMVCQKLIGTDDEETTTYRRCQLKDIDPCNFDETKISEFNRRIDYCTTCEEDGCNGTSRNQIFDMMIGIMTVITVSIHFIL